MNTVIIAYFRQSQNLRVSRKSPTLQYVEVWGSCVRSPCRDYALIRVFCDACTHRQHDEVSVPLRGLCPYKVKKRLLQLLKMKVSVPLRGLCPYKCGSCRICWPAGRFVKWKTSQSPYGDYALIRPLVRAGDAPEGHRFVSVPLRGLCPYKWSPS